MQTYMYAHDVHHPDYDDCSFIYIVSVFMKPYF